MTRCPTKRLSAVLLAALLSFGTGCGAEGGDETAAAGAAPDTTQGAEQGRAPRPATDPAAAVPGVELPVLLDRVAERGPDGSLHILDEMFPPLQSEEEAVRNRHDPGRVDTVRTLIYGGLRVEVYHVSSSAKEIIRTIEVTGEGYRTEQGLGVGSTRAEVRDALGEPLQAEGDTLVYERYRSEQDPTPTTLRFRFAGDRVAAMTWDFYVD